MRDIFNIKRGSQYGHRYRSTLYMATITVVTGLMTSILQFAQLTVSGVVFIVGIPILVTAKGFQWYFLSKGDTD